MTSNQINARKPINKHLEVNQTNEIKSEIHEMRGGSACSTRSQPPRRVAEEEKELQHNLGCTHQEFDTEKGTIGPTVHKHAVLEPKSDPFPVSVCKKHGILLTSDLFEAKPCEHVAVP